MDHMEEILKENLKDVSLRTLFHIIDRTYGLHTHIETQKLGISHGQFQFLDSLYDEDHVSQEEMASWHSLNQSTITRGLKKLESKELISRVPDENNRRKNIVVLTEKGKKFTKHIREINKEYDKLLESVLSNDEKELLKEKLTDMAIKSMASNQYFAEHIEHHNKTSFKHNFGKQPHHHDH